MRRNGIYIKSLLLLTVFSLNTVVGFACSFSNLFHGIHHHNKKETSTHQHGDRKKHHHQHDGNHHSQSTPDPKQAEENCCSATVVTIEKIEKAISRNIDAPLAQFQNISFVAEKSLIPYTNRLVRVLFPPDRWRFQATIHDLRIVIQSFQI